MFGGVILRKAYEAAHVAAYLHAGSRPCPARLSDVVFLKPVPIGSVFALEAEV